MKKNLLSILCLGISSVMMSQTFVSTTPENKNVVLEEYTGIHCTYCPDGHLLAQQLHDQNPGDVVLINIHTGSYATPSTGEPDFQTPFGSAIASAMMVSGYPAGSINRTPFPNTGPPSNPSLTGQNGGPAMSRGHWSTVSNIVFNDASCVNVAAVCSLNISTRELTVDVEAYYTNTSANTTNKINVALLQNNVEGPQTGGSSYNPGAILPNGNYNHQHMLRHLLTGQWGEDIVSTTTGSLFQNTYTYTIPSELNGVVYDLFNLEVAVFVSEGTPTTSNPQEILNGNMGSMTYIVPPGVNLIDLGATTSMSLPTSYCDNNITPEISAINNSGMSVDSFEVSYSLNGGALITQQVITPLAAGTSTTITFPSTTAPNGQNTIGYSVNTTSGTSYIDTISGNNTASSGNFYTMSATAFATNHTEGFDNYQVGSAVISNAIIENPNNENTYVVDNSITTGVSWNLGGYGNSAKSYRFRLFTFSPGSTVALIYEKLDFSNTNNNELRFSYAQAQQSITNSDKLEITVSTNCGANWTTVDTKSGSNLATAAALSGSHFYPQTTDWQTNTVDLSAYDGNNEVMIAFSATSGGGNNLYIDDIEIDEVSTTSVSEINTNISVFPNPVKDVLTIEGVYTAINIYNVFGKLVIATDYQNTIDVTGLSDGIYFLNIIKREETFIQKITIAK